MTDPTSPPGAAHLEGNPSTDTLRALDAEALLDVLCRPRLPFESLVACAALLLERDENPHFPPFLARFLVEHLRSGNAAAAARSAVASLARARDGEAWPPLPSTRGTRRLRGAETLGCEPYVLRSLLAIAARGLKRAARAHPAWTACLFEGLKLWAVAERDEFLGALFALDPAEDAIRDGVAEVVRHCGAATGPDAAEPLQSLLTAAAGHRAWTWALLDALARDAAAATRLATVLDWMYTGDPLDSDVPSVLPDADATRLDPLLCHPKPALRVLASFFRLKLENGPFAVRAPLDAVMADRSCDPRLRTQAARLLLAAGPPSDATLEAARRVLGEKSPAPSLAETVRALLAASTVTTFRAWRHDDGRAAVQLPFPCSLPAWARDEALWLAWRRVRRPVPASDWRTDEDEIGLARLTLPTLELRLFPLPATFPQRPTGAAGARREVALVAVEGPRILLGLQTPFTENGRWGTKNRLFELDPATGSWRVLAGDLAAPEPTGWITSSESPTEDDLGWLSFGELVTWIDASGRLRLFADGTPYFLDDWEHDDDTRRALQAARAYRSAPDWTVHQSLEGTRQDDWRTDDATWPGAGTLLRAVDPDARVRDGTPVSCGATGSSRFLLLSRGSTGGSLVLAWPVGPNRRP